MTTPTKPTPTVIDTEALRAAATNLGAWQQAVAAQSHTLAAQVRQIDGTFAAMAKRTASTFEAFRAMADQTLALQEPLEQLNRSLHASFQGLGETFQRLSVGPQLASLTEEFAESFKRVNESLQQPAIGQAIEALNQTLEDAYRHFESSSRTLAMDRTLQQWQFDFAESFRVFEEAFRDLPERTTRGLRALASRGWYLDAELPCTFPTDAETAISEGQHSAVDEELTEYYSTNAVAIRDRLTHRYPRRRPFLEKAFAAHAVGDYELSVPVFLAQADGICKDHTDRYLFLGDGKGRPEIAAYVERFVADTQITALLSPLAEKHPISWSRAQRSEAFTGLNRHLVLHGDSLDYNTRLSSAKAISLLAYLCWVLNEPAPDAGTVADAPLS